MIDYEKFKQDMASSIDEADNTDGCFGPDVHQIVRNYFSGYER